MTLEEILGTSMDLAGGELIRERLDSHFATGILLNVIDTMDLEISQSGRGIATLKETLTLAAGTNTGTLASTGVLGIRYVRWRRNDTDRWNVLDVVDDIDQFTRAEDRGQQAIMITGQDRTALTYRLTFTPEEAITAELWGRSWGANDPITQTKGLELDLIPKEFGMCAAYRVADFLLNQLLIINPQQYQAFVMAQKASIAGERQKTEFQWEKFRTDFSDSRSTHRSREFNVLEDYMDETDDLESFVPYRG